MNVPSHPHFFSSHPIFKRILIEKPKWLLTICLAFLFLQIRAQEPQPYDPSRVIPPSPTAASLGIYGTYNVGYYTGRPDINIPLYEIKTSNHSLPVILSYDASGVRASQQASWVGLSWSLSAGGVITRTVRGLDDFGGNGYYIAPPLPTTITLETKSYFDQISAGTMDGEADVFSYNVGPYTGKFVIGKQADGSTIFIDKANNLRIEYIYEGRWILTDGMGYKYYLGTPEYARDDYTYSDAIELNDDAPLSAYTYSTRPPVTSSWYLDSIISPGAETIKFLYESTSNSLSFIQKSEKQSDLLELIGSVCEWVSPRLPGTNKTFTASRQVIPDVYLTKIIFKNGSIELHRTDRDDIEYIDDEKPDKLSGITIRDFENNPVKTFNFHYSYFEDGALGRLKLDSLTEIDKYGNFKPPHKFTYFTTTLPNPFTKSIDHWGYFNGRGNNTLLPEFNLLYSNGTLKYFEGADRTADTLETNFKQGVLSSIVYPTGGETYFDFELHEYGNLSGDDAYDIEIERRNAIANPGNQTIHAMDTFTLTEPTSVDFSYNYVQADTSAVNYFSIEVVYAYLLREDGSTYTAFSNFDCPSDPDPTCGNTRGESTLVLPAGSYKISVFYLAGWETTMGAFWRKKVPTADAKKKGGGLRIKSITNYESGKKAGVRNFIYTTDLQTIGATTGKLISKPLYAYEFYAEDAPLWDCPPFTGHYLMRMSSAIFPMGLTSGGTVVGYDIVTESLGENGEGGKVEHTFMNSPDIENTFPFTPSYSSPFNGKLKQSVTSDSEGNPISKVENDYAIKQEVALPSIKIHQETFPTLPVIYHEIRFYSDYSRWVVKTSEKTTEHQGIHPVTNQTFFKYSNADHKEVTRVEIFRSDSAKLITKYKYPGDYAQAGTASFVSEMKARNIVSPVIEEQTLLDQNGVKKLIAGKFTRYGLFHGTLYKPDSIYALETAAPLSDTTESIISSANDVIIHPDYAPKVIFDAYTENGNLELFHTTNGTYQCYLWGYQSDLPVSHVMNASNAEIGYTSFEAGTSDGWDHAGTIIPASFPLTAPTGRNFYNLTNTDILTKAGLTNGRKYTVSYWSNNGPYSISGGSASGTVKTGVTTNGWTYYEHLLTSTGTAITVSGNGGIDEVRIYPAEAEMKTFTYDFLTGMTSSTDNNGVPVYFEYDGFQRLKSVKDYQGNVVKWNYYHYAN